MTWTVPVDGALIPAENEKLLFLAQLTHRHGSASITAVATYNAVATYTEHVAPLLLDQPTMESADGGDAQIRIVSQFNLTALGACTSLTLRHFLGVLMAPNNSGVVGANVELKAQPALTGGTLTTGWKTYDSGWLSCGSGLVTDISAYGVTIGSPVHRFDTVGGNPTIGRCAVAILGRIT
jgi:hypothetical protein